jgi:hypothetical protein
VIVGAIVGIEGVGDIVGEAVEVVGNIVGERVGSEAVGDTDGDTVGTDVVGDVDGDAVGVDLVGDPVGDTVGESVHPTQVKRQLFRKLGLAAQSPMARPLAQNPADMTSW